MGKRGWTAWSASPKIGMWWDSLQFCLKSAPISNPADCMLWSSRKVNEGWGFFGRESICCGYPTCAKTFCFCYHSAPQILRASFGLIDQTRIKKWLRFLLPDQYFYEFGLSSTAGVASYRTFCSPLISFVLQKNAEISHDFCIMQLLLNLLLGY